MTAARARRRRWLHRALLVFTCVALSAALLAGCGTMRVTPPADVQQPRRVHLVGYGMHASLVLPAGDHELIEFAYGQWEWFALGRQRWHDGLRAIACGRGTLGRRSMPGPVSSETLKRYLGAEQVHELEVEGLAADGLRIVLEGIFAAGAEEAVHNEAMEMTFVPHPRAYAPWRNCNTVVAGWLETLGCHVRGDRNSADFRIEPR